MVFDVFLMLLVAYKSILPNVIGERMMPMFLSNNFIVLAFTFRTLKI
jgi:hypothetical protein